MFYNLLLFSLSIIGDLCLFFTVRAGGKFQPKLKNQPRKPTFASAPTLVLCGLSNRSSSVLQDVKSERPLAEFLGQENI